MPSDIKRTAGLLGCLAGSIPVGLKMLTYYIAGDLPKPPVSVAVPKIKDWGMLGNDRYGDCGVAGLEHGFEVDAAITNQRKHFPTAEQTIDYYLTYTSGADSGVVLADFLSYVRKHGYYGESIDAFAPVAVQDVPTLQTATFMYGFTYCGIRVTTAMQEAFGDSKPWDATACSGQVIGGHCVPIVGYDDHYLYAVTWGGIQAITYSAWHSIATEAWAVITGEFVKRNGDGRGVSLTALRNDLNMLNI
jgi:hypothetical protein